MEPIAGVQSPNSEPAKGGFLFFSVAWLLLLWPLFVNGAPFYSEDSGSYLRGGEFGFHTGMRMIDQRLQLSTPVGSQAANVDAKASVAAAIADSGGTRSVIYSVLTYLLRWPGISLMALAIAQAGAVAFMLTALRSLLAPKSGRSWAVAVAGALALFSSAAWYAAYVVPDIFAGVAIASAVILTVFFERFGLVYRIVLILLLAGSITFHGSHLPLALATLIAGGSASFWLNRSRLGRFEFSRVLWFISPIVLASAALLGTSYVAFGEFSLNPKRYPIALARSVADGPGAWHLRDHCATERYAICEIYGRNPPRDVGDFLWGENGVRHRASPEQMERIRAEESVIVRRAFQEYPGNQLRRSATNTVFQLAEFGPGSLIFGRSLVGRDDPQLIATSPDRHDLKRLGKLLIYLGFAAALAVLIALRRKLERVEVAAVAVTAVGLLANAAICGGLSAVTDRYQGRVAWVLPALAFFILLRVWGEKRPAATIA